MYFPFSSLKHSFSAKVLGGSSGICPVTLCCELWLVPYQSPGSEMELGAGARGACRGHGFRIVSAGVQVVSSWNTSRYVSDFRQVVCTVGNFAVGLTGSQEEKGFWTRHCIRGEGACLRTQLVFSFCVTPWCPPVFLWYYKLCRCKVKCSPFG